MDTIMEVAMSQTWIYNQSWEDPRTDIKHFKLGKGDKICMLTTGGDNVLDYLIEDPEYIDTFDMNMHQSFLLDMKCACVKELDHEDCFAILAKQDFPRFQKHYPLIRNHLAADSRAWWDSNQHRMKNWHLSGSCKVAAKAAILLLNLFGCGKMIDELRDIAEPTLEKQQAIYAKYRTRVQLAARFNQSWMNTMIGFVGVPMHQWSMYENRDNLISELLEYICNGTLLFGDNYFYASYLSNGWSEDCCPRYLSKEFFPIVKQRVNRIKIFTATLTDGVMLPGARRGYTRFVLLDHQDWLSEEQIARSWSILAKVGAPGALVGWRSFGVLPFGCLSNLEFHVKGVIGRAEPNEYSDRVGMYNGLFCAKLPEVGSEPIILSEPGWKKQSLFESLRTFAAMFLAPVTTILAKDHTEFLDNFYAQQAESYDTYRAKMLHGKREVMWAVPWNSKPKRVLLFGGGTGDVLEYISDLVPTFNEVVVLDLCGPLLNQARARAERKGWTNVSFVHGDATVYEPAEKFDVVISSYVFTMIPDWKKAIAKAWECVAPNGYLAATDFTLNPKDQYGMSQWMWKTVFSFDHVNLNAEHYETIKKLGTLCAFRCSYGGFPFVPLLQCPYYTAVQQKCGKKEE